MTPELTELCRKLRAPLTIQYAVPLPVAETLQRAADERDEAASAIETLAVRVGELERLLEPFDQTFDRARERYARRYEDHSIGYRYFDDMPDAWLMDRLTFAMGEFRAIRAALKEPSDG